MIQTGFHVSRPTQVVLAPMARYPYGAFTLCGPAFRPVPVPTMCFIEDSYNPGRASTPPV